jgi:hypothetical protein
VMGRGRPGLEPGTSLRYEMSISSAFSNVVAKRDFFGLCFCCGDKRIRKAVLAVSDLLTASRDYCRTLAVTTYDY